MEKNECKNFIASLILTLAVGCMLAVSGIYVLMGKYAGDLAVSGLKSIFDGKTESIVITAFGIVELLAGIFIVSKCFFRTAMGNVGKIFSMIVVIVWIAVIILSDIVSGICKPDFLSWLLRFSKDLIIFCAIWICCR